MMVSNIQNASIGLWAVLVVAGCGSDDTNPTAQAISAGGGAGLASVGAGTAGSVATASNGGSQSGGATTAGNNAGSSEQSQGMGAAGGGASTDNGASGSAGAPSGGAMTGGEVAGSTSTNGGTASGDPANGGSVNAGATTSTGGMGTAGSDTAIAGDSTGGALNVSGMTASQGGSDSGGSNRGGSESGGSDNSDSGGGGSESGGSESGGSESGGSGSDPAEAGAMSSAGAAGAEPEPPLEAIAMYGERYPFPQNVNYPYGLRSAEISARYVRDWYDAWSEKYLQECNGNLRPGVDPLSKSVVEAQGFAMVAAAYMGDKPVVDQLYSYYQDKLTSSGCGLMGWKNNCQGIEDEGSATDGDVDVASGLIVAHWQWPDDGYDDKARTVISTLTRMIVNCSGTTALYPGCANGSPWGGCNETDVSYHSPAFFRYFAEFSGDSAWTKLADDSHVLRDNAANSSTGLVPDWQSVSGNAGAGSRKGYFSFDAIRTPYKHALDFLWNGTASAGAWCEKLTTWAYGQGVETIKDGYQLNGSVEGSNHNLATVGSMAVCAMANSQEILDAFVAESVTLPDDYWYSGYLGNLYLLALSGNMWNPDLVGD